jgi:ribosomal protein S12 methylthiotransferase
VILTSINSPIGISPSIRIKLSTSGTSIGRSYRDAPEVDNFIRIDGEIPIGEFIDVKITDASEYELIGEQLQIEQAVL